MDAHLSDEEDFAFGEPESVLERMLLEGYLKERGIASLKELGALPRDQARLLMQHACRNASLKLAEVESVGRFPVEDSFGEWAHGF